MQKNKLYVQYGCGLSAPEGWLNYDASPTLKIQRIPLIGYIFYCFMDTAFPRNVKFGDIVKGLPLPINSCDGLYCSHVLEHLSLDDCRVALKNSYMMLKAGGTFRLVLPDLELAAREYIKSLDLSDNSASIAFMGRNTLVGLEKRPKGIISFVKAFFGNHNHLWMWDYFSLAEELSKVGFTNIRRCHYNDSDDKMFLSVEELDRFNNALAIECKK